MISILTHGLSPGELMARRLAATSLVPCASAAAFGAFEPSRAVAAGDRMFASGRSSAPPLMLVAGAAGEMRKLSGGRRQIVRLRLPGDLLYPCTREAVVAISRARVVDARPILGFIDRPGQSTAIRRAWISLAQAEQDLLRDQLVRLGRMTAVERLAHLILETHERLRRVGLTEGDAFHLPATQETMSDLVGLSVVHLSRTLSALRRDAHVRLRRGGIIEIRDRVRLELICAWRPDGLPQDAPTVSSASTPLASANG